MTSFIYDASHHLTGFEMLYPDGGIRASFTLTAVQTLTERQIRTGHLRQLGLREGTDFTVVNASELPVTVLNQDSMRGRRTVLSYSGLLQLVLRAGNNDFSNRLRWWITDEVIPGIMRDGYYRASDVDEMVTELRERVSQLEQLVDLGFGDMTLGDLAGWDG
jgi:prophage antirepressor-like protein